MSALNVTPTHRPKVAEPAAHIDGDVEDLAADDSNQLALGTPQLQMQAPQRSAGRFRMVVLHERAVDAVLAIAIGVIGLEEKAAAIDVHRRLDDQDLGDAGGNDAHVRPRSQARAAGTARTNSVFMAAASRFTSAAEIYPMR